jgi:nitric oxide reductase large subunit
VEGTGFYGLNLDNILPYSVSRTWHVQLALFWIATSWLAAGLYIAPAVSGSEPKFQRLGVNVLFVALLVIVLGSIAGEWMGIMQKLGLVHNFWFGHQGYEYVAWKVLADIPFCRFFYLALPYVPWLVACAYKTVSEPSAADNVYYSISCHRRILRGRPDVGKADTFINC